MPTSPNYNWTNYSSFSPGAYRAIYEIRLNPKQNVTASYWQGTDLYFYGELGLDATLGASFIDVTTTQTENIGNNNASHMTYVKAGIVQWSLGEIALPCDGSTPTQDPILFNQGGGLSTQPYALLGKIVLWVTPYVDKIDWLKTQAQTRDCKSIACDGGGSMLTVDAKPLVLNNPPACVSNIEISDFNPGQSSNPSLIVVSLTGTTANFAQNHGVIRIHENMLSIANISYDLATGSQIPNDYDVIQVRHGTYVDVYFSKKDPLLLTAPGYMFGLKIGGSWNASQGGNLHIEYLGGCVAHSGMSGVCKPNSTPFDIDLGGLPNCVADGITITGEPWYDFSPDIKCAPGFRFRVTHNKPSSLPVSEFKLKFIFIGTDPQGQGSGLPPILIGLPGDATNVTITNLPANRVIVEYYYPAFNLVSGSEIRMPVFNPTGCYDGFVLLSEAKVGSNQVACSFFTALPANSNSLLRSCNQEITGKVVLRDGSPGPDSQIAVETNSTPPASITTLFPICANGLYSYCADSRFAPFRLTASKNGPENWTCGVSTYDLVLLSKHILGYEPFTSPYQWVAGDVNYSGNVSTGDIVDLRKLILGLPNGIPLYNPDPLHPQNTSYQVSWRYIRDGFVFGNNPAGAVKFAGTTTNIAAPVPIAGTEYGKFTAVKIGDVNLIPSCKGCDALRPDEGVDRYVVKRCHMKGVVLPYLATNEIRLRITASEVQNIIGIQNGFRFDPQVLELKRIEGNIAEGIGPNFFGTTNADENGEIRFSWISQDAETPMLPNTWLFDLVFERKTKDLSTHLNLPFWASDVVLSNEAYDSKGEKFAATVSIEAPNYSQENLVIMIRPNPATTDFTEAFIQSNMDAKALCYLRNTNGQILWTSDIELSKGENLLRLPLQGVSSGTYFFSIVLDANGASLQKKVIVLGF